MRSPLFLCFLGLLILSSCGQPAQPMVTPILEAEPTLMGVEALATPASSAPTASSIPTFAQLDTSITATEVPSIENTAATLPTAEDSATAITETLALTGFQNEEYQLAFSYPTCLGELSEQPLIGREVGLENRDNMLITTSLITPVIEFKSVTLNPQECPADRLQLAIFPLEGYRLPLFGQELLYNQPDMSWWLSNGTNQVASDEPLYQGSGWQGHAFSLGDAEFLSRGIAIPRPDQGVMVEIRLTAILPQQEQTGVKDVQVLDAILASLIFIE